ncbi:hypothetical protein ACYVVD_08185 [Arenicellales bacterium IMCC58067]
MILDLYIAYLADPLMFISYSRDRNKFSKTERLGRLFLGYGPLKRVIDGLETLGFIENHIGFYDQKRKFGFQSRMRATPALIDLIETGGVTSFMVSYDIGEVVLLRDADGKDLSFPETEETRAIADQVRSYNQFLSEHRISLALDADEIRQGLIKTGKRAVDYTRTQLYRAFKVDFSSGGRYYRGWWQEVPSGLRKYITIDGENCSELDYSGQSLGLLYAYKGHERAWMKGDGDPYEIDGKVDRSLMKQVFITSVNAASRDEAFASIRDDINKKHKNLKSTKALIDFLINQTISNHPDIAEYFFSSGWAGLQYQDSEIAKYILEHMQAHGYPALPIHDSFVVQDQHLPQLFSLMKEAYRMLGVTSIPDITLDRGANSDPNSPPFKALEKLMDQEQQMKDKELQSVKALEDYVD